MAELAHAPAVAGSATGAALLRGGGEGPAGGGGGPLHASFPRAGQPDLVRAGQKDDFYVQACSSLASLGEGKAPGAWPLTSALPLVVSQRLRDTLLDVTQRLAGHRRAMAWEEEVSLASAVLYYGLTTASGSPTLGEEYCDLHTVTGAAQRPVSTLRRLLLLTLQTVVPYALQREQCVGPQTGRGSSQLTDNTHVRRLAASWSPPAGSDPCPPARADPAASAIAASASALVAAWRQQLRAALPRLAEPLALAARAHLALFYLYGVYLTPAHRVAGVRRIFIGQRVEPRIQYGVLGVLLAAQVAVQCAQLALRSTAQTVASSQGGQRGHAVVMDANGKAFSLAPPRDGDQQEEGVAAPGAPTCPLCLSPRRSPAATPCGHVFCWACAAGWTATQPLCPLCRAPARPQDLVPLYNMA